MGGGDDVRKGLEMGVGVFFLKYREMRFVFGKIEFV